MNQDGDGGVCLIKNLHYFTYNSISSGCTCYDVITEINENIPIGYYMLPYVNKNQYFTYDTGNTDNCLIITNINNWYIDYINTVVTSGYIGNSGLTYENRVLYDMLSGNFYKIEMSASNNCSGDTIARYAIINKDNNEIWVSGSTNYFYDLYDDCGNISGVRHIKTKDINPNSSTYNYIKTITKCQNETAPIVSLDGITNITTSGLTATAVIINNGGFEITERGFCYSNNRYPTLDNFYVENNTSNYTFSNQIINLDSRTYYYIRAYAINSIGISYSPQILIATKKAINATNNGGNNGNSEETTTYTYTSTLQEYLPELNYNVTYNYNSTIIEYQEELIENITYTYDSIITDYQNEQITV